MFNISDYFKKISKITNDNKTREEIIKNLLKEICNIDDVKFSINNGIVYIKENPSIKNIIFIKKQKILSSLKDKKDVLNQIIVDIR